MLLLLGISAVGAAGGKITYAAKRRLSLENWAWLRRKGWLPAGRDVAQRAQWSELFLDSDTKEFDPYSFQMALFSLVVAVALLRTDPTSLGTFQVPPELLALLGISQAVFIGGKAIEKSGYGELDTKLADLRDHEAKFQQASVRGDKAKADEERQAFKASATQTAEIFWAIYGEQLQEMPPALASASTMEPDLH